MKKLFINRDEVRTLKSFLQFNVKNAEDVSVDIDG